MAVWGSKSRLTLFVGALSLAACGGDDSSGSGDDGSSSESDASGSGPSGSGSETAGSASTTGTSDTATTTDSGSDSASATASESDSDGGSTGDEMNLGEKVELRIDNYEIPTTETFYACFEFSFSLEQLGHITQFRPFIDNGSYVHHFVLTQVDQPSGEPQGTSCFDLDGDIIWAWAPGLTDFTLPPEAGFLVGNAPDGRAHFRLQVHYNNPQNTAGEVDSSGFDMWVTTELRPNTAGTLVVADVIGGQPIPGGQQAYEHITTCSGQATQNFLDGPINVFGSSLHAHEIGSVLWTNVMRDGEMLYELNRNEPFSFEDQRLDEVDFVINPGDEIVNHCIYDSTNRSGDTNFGPGTEDEMCWNALIYYPKISNGFDFCSSGN